MRRPGACPRAVLAGAFATALVVTPCDYAGAGSEAVPAVDVDPVSIAGPDAEFDGSLSWSHSRTRPTTSARLTGRLSAAGGDCARVHVDWLNAGTGTLSSSRSACVDSGGVALRFRHASLECARIRLLVKDGQTGPTRLLCAGGS